MIVVTVGTQLPFPRLIGMIEDVVTDGEEVFVQTADPDYSGPLPSSPFLSRDEFAGYCRRARIIVGHTGTGTIFAAREFRKPLIVVPRRHHLGEHRSDHQYATARELGRIGQAAIAEDAQSLAEYLRSPPAALARGENPERLRLIERLAGLLR